MHGSKRGSIEKYNPETINRRPESVGAMQRPQGSRRASARLRSSGSVSINPDTKQKPGAVSRPGTFREFQFPESTESQGRVKSCFAWRLPAPNINRRVTLDPVLPPGYRGRICLVADAAGLRQCMSRQLAPSRRSARREVWPLSVVKRP
jgi:hypothetical protein